MASAQFPSIEEKSNSGFKSHHQNHSPFAQSPPTPPPSTSPTNNSKHSPSTTQHHKKSKDVWSRRHYEKQQKTTSPVVENVCTPRSVLSGDVHHNNLDTTRTRTPLFKSSGYSPSWTMQHRQGDFPMCTRRRWTSRHYVRQPCQVSPAGNEGGSGAQSEPTFATLDDCDKSTTSPSTPFNDISSLSVHAEEEEEKDISADQMFDYLLGSSFYNSLYQMRKTFLEPTVEESCVAKNNGKYVVLKWWFPATLTPAQRLGLAGCSFGSSPEADGRRLILGEGTSSTKDSARKLAISQLLRRAGSLTPPEFVQAFGWVIGQEKTLQKGVTKEATTKVPSNGTCLSQIIWTSRANPSETPIEVIARGKTSVESLGKARAALFFRLRQLQSESRLPMQTMVEQQSRPTDLGMSTLSSSSSGSSLLPHDISDILQRSQLMMIRLGIEEKFEFRVQGSQHACDINWTFTDEKGYPCIATATCLAATKKGARANARVQLLQQLGVEESVSNSERKQSRMIKDLLAGNDLTRAVHKTGKFIAESSTEAWGLVLPLVWRAALASYDLTHIQSLLLPLQNTTAGSIGNPSRQLPVLLWESLLDACVILNNSRIGFSALALLGGGSTYNFMDKLESSSGFNIHLDESSFPSISTMRFFQSYRTMLAFEYRAEISRGPIARRQDITDSITASSSSSSEFTDTSTAIELHVIQKAPSLLRLQAKVTPDVDRFLQQANLRDDDVALLRPGCLDERSSWSKACVVRIVSLTVKNSILELSARLATDESLGQSLSSPSFLLYVLSTTISLDRMIATLRVLCLSKWPFTEKRPVMYFSTPIQYILLNANTLEARSVAKRGAVPADFLERIAPSGIVSPAERKRAEVLRQTPETMAIHIDSNPDSALIRSPQFQALTSQQQLAVVSALTNRLTLIQGPPGTGKTHTACSIIYFWKTAYPHRKILAVADSNVAADNLSEGLIKRGVRSARVGAGSDVDVQDYFRSQAAYETVYETEFSKQKAYKYERMKLFRQLIASNQVIITTCIGSGHPMFEDFQFDHVIIDECAHSTEPASLVPLSRGCNSLVLIGDYQQLTAMVLSREANDRGLGVSLMERLAEAQVTEVYLLDVQRRMHPSIAEYPNNQFYNGRIRNEDVNDSTRPPITGFVFPNPAIRVCLVTVQPKKSSANGLEATDGSSKFNMAEAQYIPSILQSVLGHQSLKPTEIGILTPYMAQKKYIKRLLTIKFPPEMIAGLEVDTIDGFQGKEKELIIFSAVRSNSRGDVGFLVDSRRMNVMLTRARRGLIVLADPNTLQSEKTNWSLWLQWVTSRKAVISSDMLKLYLSYSHPDPRAAEDAALAVCEGRLVNLWPSPEEKASTSTQYSSAKINALSFIKTGIKPSDAATAAHKYFYVNDLQDDSDNEDWYGDKAAEAAVAAAAAEAAAEMNNTLDMSSSEQQN